MKETNIALNKMNIKNIETEILKLGSAKVTILSSIDLNNIIDFCKIK